MSAVSRSFGAHTSQEGGRVRRLAPQLAQVFRALGKDDRLYWKADGLGDRLDRCLVYVAWDGILIRPVLPPTGSHRHFAEADQRLYVSATLGEGGELERSFGRAPIARLAIPEGWDARGAGRRFFVFPDLQTAVPARRLGLDAQRAAVEAACAAKGWTVTDWAVDEGVSGSVAPADRPAMARALRLLDSRDAGALVAAKVDRIARDLHDLTGLLRRADEDGWALVALDLGVDTTTPVGRMLVGILGSVAEWERSVIRQRTRDALAAKKAAGARLGHPVSPEAQPARARLRELLHDRLPLAAIVATLNGEGYTTPTALPWTWRHVQKTRDSLALDDLATVP